MRRVLVRTIVGIFTVIGVCLLVILYQNNYHMTVTAVDIPTSKGILKGNLVLPKNLKGKAGLVVFIHGDGPADASYHEHYKPLWEELASQGYASLSWNKPGISGSSGNWLDQTMDDRAAEAFEVIRWARTLPEINGDKIGLWGASQAGWVIPKIVQLDDHIAFNILVAPAVNWIDQGLYNTLAQMQKDGRSLDQQEQAKKSYEDALSLLERKASYEEYLRSDGADQKMTKDRWSFILKNYKSDSTEDIRHFYSPVKLFLGGMDINVDSQNTKAVYEKEVKTSLLSVTLIPTADHSMLRAPLVHSESLTVLTALFAPRKLADKEYYEGIRQFLKTIN